VLKGFESTVFAYGQTGTGKTFTLEGNINDPEQQGIIPRAAQSIFDKLKHPQYSDKRVTVSYLEIYNEDLCDLLVDQSDDNNNQLPPKRATKLDIMEGKNGTFCRGLSEKEVTSAEDVLSLMQKAQLQRHVGETKMNKESSRSHCIFTMNVKANMMLKDGAMEFNGKLHMVDLAGSECAKTANLDKPSAVDAARERERLNINRSLLTLGRVISMLKEMNDSNKKSNNIRIPYRDSKLTRILQESLGGRCKTVIIATLSPSITAIEESMSTLNYAQAAIGIVNKPISTSFMSLPGSNPGTFCRTGEDGEKAPENQVEYWHEMECRLQYMQAQVEEAQAALARKHLQQQEVQERLEKAEADIYEWEKKFHSAEMRINELESNIECETLKRQAVEAKLEITEQELEKRSAILRATQETESRLTSEANMLLETLEQSVNEGHKLQALLQEKAEIEATKIAATKSLHKDAEGILNESSLSLSMLSQSIKSQCQTISSACNQMNSQSRQSIAKAIELVSQIASVSTSMETDVKRKFSGEKGMQEQLESSFNQIIISLASLSRMVESNEESVTKLCETAQANLKEQTQALAMLQKEHVKLAADKKNEINTVVKFVSGTFDEISNAVMIAIENARVAREESRVKHLKCLEELNDSNLASSKRASALAFGQADSLQSKLESYKDGMKIHESLENILVSQNKVLSTNGKEHLTQISAQAALVANHEQMIQESQRRSKEIQTACVHNLFQGIQQVVNTQMNELLSQYTQNYQTLLESTHQLKTSNGVIDQTSNQILSTLINATSQLRNDSQQSRNTDMKMLHSLQQSSQKFTELGTLTKSQTESTSSLFVQAKSTFDQLSTMDSKNLNTLEHLLSLSNLGNETASGPLYKGIDDSIEKLCDSSHAISRHTYNSIISPTQNSLDSLPAPMSNMKHQVKEEEQKIKQTILQQTSQLEVLSSHLHDSLNSTTKSIQTFQQEHDQLIGGKLQALLGKTEIAVNQTSMKMVDEETSFRLSSTQRIEQIRSQIKHFAEVKMKVNDELQPPPVKQNFSYSRALSATPCESDILRAFTPRNESNEDSLSSIKTPEDKENGELNKSASDDGIDSASVRSDGSSNVLSIKGNSMFSPPRVLRDRNPNIARNTSRQTNRTTLSAQKTKRPASSNKHDGMPGTPSGRKKIRTGTPARSRLARP